MGAYFAIKRKFSLGGFKLKFEYSVTDVDTLALFRSLPTPNDYLNKFSYSKTGGEILDDLLANDIGFYIFSGRITKVFEKCLNRDDIELLPLPAQAARLEEKLRSYCVLGIKREIECVDLEHSEILWGMKDGIPDHILSFRKCVLDTQRVPENMDVFLIREYPVMPIISARLAAEFAKYYPTGFVFEKIPAI